MANADWIKIKNEYINTNISYRKLAEKYEVSKNQVANRAKYENWQELRKKQQDKIGTKLGQKTAEKIVEAEIGRVAKLLKIADTAQEKIETALEQLTMYVDVSGNVSSCDIIDVAKLKKLTSCIKELKEVLTVDNGETTNEEKKQTEFLNAIKKAVQDAD